MPVLVGRQLCSHRPMNRYRRPLRLCSLLLLLYLLLLASILLVLGYGLQWSAADRLVMAITPSFAHNYLASLLFNSLSISPASPLFGLFARPLPPTEALWESSWMKSQRVSLEPSSDCSNFGASEMGDVLAEKVRTEQEVSEALDRWFGASGGPSARLESGGWFSPGDCRPRETLAIVVPYRDRFQNLLTFLNYMHRFLQHQRRRYVIVLAEQANYNVSFNRAKLFNAAVRELLAQREPRIDCFVLHDVEKVPYHLFNLYACGFQPRQLATAIGGAGRRVGAVQWTPFYRRFLGAVTAFSRWQLLRMNGASNVFYGWGGEDDDMALRAALAGYAPTVPDAARGRMWVMGHHDDKKEIPQLYKSLTLSPVIQRMQHDGLAQVAYAVVASEKRQLYTLLSFRL